MDKRKFSSESGQIIVILALTFVGLLGFGALAIDVGMIYSDRRQAQNAADSAALAAAQKISDVAKNNTTFNCNSISRTEATNAAVLRATSNGFPITYNAAENGISYSCPANPSTYIDMTVTISAVSKTAFMHMFYGGQAKNTVTAVSRFYPRQPMVPGYLMYILGTTCTMDNKIDWNGTVDAYLFGAGAFTRSCVDGNGNTKFIVVPAGQTVAACQGTGQTAEGINCHDGNAATHPDWCEDPGDNFNPNPDFLTDPKPDFTIPDITGCSATEITTAPADHFFTPGTYNIGSNDWDGAKLRPGLYCIRGSISPSGNGATITSVDSADGTTHGVTLYMIDGGITCTGNCAFNVRAVAQDAAIKPAGAIPGLLLMAKHGNTSTIKVGGNSNASMSGTVYVPDGVIDIGGTSNVPMATQFIAKGIKSHGNAPLCMTYDPNMTVTSPANLQLQR